MPAFRDLPATLDLRVVPGCPPGPRSCSVVEVGAELSVDGVADPSFHAAHRFFAALPVGLFREVVGAAGCVVTDLTECGDVDRVVQLPVAVRVEPVTNVRSRRCLDRCGRVVAGVVSGAREPTDVTAVADEVTRDDRTDTDARRSPSCRRLSLHR